MQKFEIYMKWKLSVAGDWWSITFASKKSHTEKLDGRFLLHPSVLVQS